MAMRSIVNAALILVGFEGCIPLPPAWITGETRDAWTTTRDLSLIREVTEPSDDSIDVFSSWYLGGAPSSVPHFEGVSFRNRHEYNKFLMSYSAFYPAIPNAILDDLIPRFWINRPSWYFPTRQEVESVRSVVSDTLMALAFRERLGVEGEMDVARAMSFIGEAVFSVRTSRVLQSPETPIAVIDNDMLFLFVSFMGNNVLRRLVDTAISHIGVVSAETQMSDIDYVVSLLDRPETRNAGLIHVNDYLDHEGHKPESLSVWKRVFLGSSFVETIRQVAMLIAVKPDVVENATFAHEKRITNYQRGMRRAWLAWAQTSGDLIDSVWTAANQSGRQTIQNCMPTAANIEITEDSMQEIFDFFDSHRADMNRFNICFISKLLNGSLTIPNDAQRMPQLVASLLHMIKYTSDPLAMMVATQ